MSVCLLVLSSVAGPSGLSCPSMPCASCMSIVCYVLILSMLGDHVYHERCYCVSARVHVVMYCISALCMVTMYLLYYTASVFCINAMYFYYIISLHY